MVAQPSGVLASCANRYVERRNKNMPPVHPRASRATQNPCLLRPTKKSGITRLRTPTSDRLGRPFAACGIRCWNEMHHRGLNRAHSAAWASERHAHAAAQIGAGNVRYRAVRQLRQKIEADPERPQFILTETGIGQRLRAPD